MKNKLIRASGFIGILGLLITISGCGRSADKSEKNNSEPPESLESSLVKQPSNEEAETISLVKSELFSESAEKVGLHFTHFNGKEGSYYMPEIMGAGAAVLDYDNDGDLDVYLVQGNYFSPDDYEGSHPLPKAEMREHRDRLFRNDLNAEEGGGNELHFTDVTEESGICSTGYGMGVATGDINNDGWTDIYVTNYGPNTWWLNQGDGTFKNYDALSGVDDPGLWSSSASFFDFDRDGWLDLFVCEYVHFTFANHVECKNMIGGRGYCGPQVYPYEKDRLLKNRGAGTFEDVSLTSHIATKAGAGLGVVAADFNGDHWTDIYVANDGMANYLWVNQGDGTFQEQALISGCALNMVGAYEASMGVDAADFDQDGDEDLFMTHLLGEKNTLYLNDGHGLFSDRTHAFGLDGPSRPYTAFGTGWFDLDNDGDLDLYVVNGAVKAVEELLRQGDPYPYEMPNQLFENQGGHFKEIDGGDGFGFSEISRGSVEVDLDNDGDLDLLITNNDGPVRLLINQTGSQQPWIGFRVLDKSSGVDLIGAKVALVRDGVPVAWRRVRTDGSYCSSRDPRVLFGLKNLEFDEVLLILPDGSRRAVSAGFRKREYNTLYF